MARIRSIKPDFFSDETIGNLSMPARLIFIGTWTLADDEGLLNWTAPYIKAHLLAYDPITLDEVKSAMNEIVIASLVREYLDPRGRSFGWIINFRKHQRIDKPQPPKHPLPPLHKPEVRSSYLYRAGCHCEVCGEAIDGEDEFIILSKRSGRVSTGEAPSNQVVVHHDCDVRVGDFDVAVSHRRVNEEARDTRRKKSVQPSLFGDDSEALSATTAEPGEHEQDRLDIPPVVKAPDMNDLMSHPPEVEESQQLESAEAAEPEPDSEKKPQGNRRKPKRPFPADFEVTDDMKAWFRDHKFQFIELERATEQWKSSMLAHGNVYANWQQAWRTGMLKAEGWARDANKRFSGGGGGGGNGPGGGSGPGGGVYRDLVPSRPRRPTSATQQQ